MRWGVLIIVLLSVVVASAQQQPQAPEAQPEATVQPAEPSVPGAAPKPGHPLDPEDVRVLTAPAVTSVPAAQRGGYGAPQVYMTPYGGVPMFQYGRHVPLFGPFGLAPLPTHFGFVPRPIRPVGPFQFFGGRR